MLVRVNKGVLIAYERYGVERMSEVLQVTYQTVYNLRNGKRQITIPVAAKLHDALKIGWVNFKHYEDVPPAGMMRGEK